MPAAFGQLDKTWRRLTTTERMTLLQFKATDVELEKGPNNDTVFLVVNRNTGVVDTINIRDFLEVVVPAQVTTIGAGVDSTLIATGLKFPMGYATEEIALDTIYFITPSLADSVNVTPKLYFGSDIGTTGTAIISSPSAITSHHGVTKVYSFDNGTITRGSMIWLTFSAVGTKPRNIMVQMRGH